MPENLSSLATSAIKSKKGCSSKKAKAEASITLNTLLYDQSTVAERLTQVQGRSVEEYRNRATRYIMEFERAFAGNGVERTKYEAKF